MPHGIGVVVLAAAFGIQCLDDDLIDSTSNRSEARRILLKPLPSDSIECRPIEAMNTPFMDASPS